MKVRRFVAHNTQDALSKVRSALGKEAIILQIRRVKEGGFLGLFGRNLVEVTAAVDDDLQDLQKKQSSLVPPVHSITSTVGTNEVKKEIAEVKKLLGQMIQELENNSARTSTYPKVVDRLYKNLVLNEVEENLARKIINETLEHVQPTLWKDETEVSSAIEEIIAKRLLRPKPISFKNNCREKKKIALVGPTGVGKTTTIAKLAAIFSIIEKKKVALATVDTYRVAAVEQLKTYAEIVALPLEIAYTPADLKAALEKHQDKDLILIDTAGRSPLNEVQMAELKAFLEPCSDVECLLVLGATTKQADLWETIQRFNHLSFRGLIFTKLDETQKYGAILNIVNRLKKSLAYVTTGQTVPDDIEVPDPHKIARLILRGKTDE